MRRGCEEIQKRLVFFENVCENRRVGVEQEYTWNQELAGVTGVHMFS